MLVRSSGWQQGFRPVLVAIVSCGVGLCGPGVGAALGVQVTVASSADGTIADGGSFGAFDGVPDSADWTFNDSGFEGAISLSRRVPQFEYRVVFEYDLNAVRSYPLIAATLTFKLRGGTRFPADPTPVQVQAYPADVVEKIGDFSAGPSSVAANLSIPALQPATSYTIDVSVPVMEALASGARGIGFRFQVAPNAPADSNQAFMDILDADPTTKPSLSIRLPGDMNGDGDVDLLDFRSVVGCMKGPGTPATPACAPADLDVESHVDLRDVAAFVRSPALVVTP